MPVLPAADSVEIAIFATTDLHGNLLPYDYYTARPAPRGLSKIATLLREGRQRHPLSMLIDCGDTIQGAPIESVYQQAVRFGKPPGGLAWPSKPLDQDPMMLAMNYLGYDSMTVGNHEYNYGLENIRRARAVARFPWLSANTRVDAGAAIKPFAPYLVKTLGGVKVAVIGITTPAIPSWERPEHYQGLRFIPGKEALTATVDELRAKEDPDVIIVAVHAGLERDPESGKVKMQELAGENMVDDMTNVPGVDAIVFGHTHEQLPEARIRGVLLMQPKNWGMSLGEINFKLEKVNGKWKVQQKSSHLIPVTAETAEDPAVVAIAKPYHELAERYLDRPVAESPVDLSGARGRIEDSALVDAIQRVQLHYTHADVSLTALFNPSVRVPKGKVTARQVAALYIYDNQLYTVQGNGKMLREALENAARYFKTCPTPECTSGPLIDRTVLGFNYDMAEGVTYHIDLNRPAGSRIVDLRYRGKPLADDQRLRIALNNYRAGGSGGYTMFVGAPILWRSSEDIRDLIIEYYSERKMLPAQPSGNWSIVPAAAVKELDQELASDVRRNTNK